MVIILILLALFVWKPILMCSLVIPTALFWFITDLCHKSDSKLYGTPR